MSAVISDYIRLCC